VEEEAPIKEGDIQVMW